ncbi:MAG: dienelactone hydrolase family protein [Vicinamibacteria bacterium]|nr:dienelactone hydrolase family protein [Vicinamibacteria bacterium]
MATEWAFDAGGEATSASVHGAGESVLVLGPGAGGTRRTPFLLRIAEAIAQSGRAAVLFHFPYSEAGRGRPDSAPKLERTVAAVAALARERLRPRTLVLGGKSMGGRMASMAAASGLACDGLVFFGYPLHPPGKEHQLRDAHLPRIAAPMLFLQGTRDDFARFDLIEAVTGRLGPGATLVRLEGADHSFGVLKRSGRTAAEVEAEMTAALFAWLSRIERKG